jgi:hypothetical protein
MVMMVMDNMVLGRRRHGLCRDSFCAIGSSLGVTGRLLDTAGRSLGRSRSLLSLLARRFRARSRLISAIGRVHGALCGIGLV